MNSALARTHGGDNLWRRFAIAAPYLWLLAFFLVPFGFVLKISFSDPIIARPPFHPAFRFQRGRGASFSRHPGQLPLPVRRQSVPHQLPQVPAGRADFHLPVSAHRLSAGLRHRPHRQPGLAQHLSAPDHPAVLDLVPVAGLRLDRPVEHPRPH